MVATFDKNKHIQFLNIVIGEGIDKDIIVLDTSRMTLVYFILSSFDVLKSSDKMLLWKKEQIIEAIYSYQIDDEENSNQLGKWGFRGSFSNGSNNVLDSCHIALTYCALCSLIICGDDLRRVNRSRIIKKLGEYQKKNGCFISTAGGESDMRFCFTASSICYILNDFSSINIDKMLEFIMSCLTYEGAFSQTPGSEAHGGSTYCALAALKLLDKLDDCLDEKKKDKLVKWCLMKQDQGFEGRPNKTSDTCYTFWVGASLAILGKHHLINSKRLRNFCFNNQDKKFGGFAKHFDNGPDPMHTYLALSGLSIEKDNDLDLETIVPELNITERSFKHLKNIIPSYL